MTTTSTSFHSKDRYLLVPKALYFLCSCFMYAPSLYQAKYLQDVWKIPANHYGYLNIVTVFSILASLTWSGLADRYRAHKRILMLKSLLYGFSYCSMWLLEPFMLSWTMKVRVAVITTLFLTTTVFCSAIFPLLGTLVFSILESSDFLLNGPIPPKRLLGRQKLFGTLGLGLVFALNGTLTDIIGYQAQFLIVSLSCLFFFAIAYFGLDHAPKFRPVTSSIDKNVKAAPTTASAKVQNNSWMDNVRILLSNWDFISLLFIVFLIGVVGSVFNVYFSIFMGMILKHSTWKNLIMGYMYAIRLTVEIPIYVWGDVLMSAFGPYGVLLMGMAASALRPFGYAFFLSDGSMAYWGFILELFKGFSHACNGLGGCVLASEMAPPGAQGTAQALFTSAHHHAASVISGLCCSLYLGYRRENTVDEPTRILIYRDLFFWAGIIGLIGTILNTHRLIIHKKRGIK